MINVLRRVTNQERIDELKNLLNSLNHGDNIEDWETVSTAIHTIGMLLLDLLKKEKEKLK